MPMQETSGDITTGAIVSHGRKKRLGLDIYSEREAENHESGGCIKRKVSHEEIEAILIASYGNKVNPRIVYDSFMLLPGRVVARTMVEAEELIKGRVIELKV